MTIATTKVLWKVEAHKIHIKEWAENKERILGMVPWDDKRKQLQDTFKEVLQNKNTQRSTGNNPNMKLKNA